MSRLPQLVPGLTIPPSDPDVADQGPGSANSTSFLISPDFGAAFCTDQIPRRDLICRDTRDYRPARSCRDTGVYRKMLTPRGSVLPALADGAGTRKNLMYNEYEKFMKNAIPMSE